MEHRADGLEIFGVQPEIQRLFNDRYRLTFRCELGDNVDDWYYANRDNIFADFDTLSDAGYGNAPATPDPDSTWPNQRLVKHGLNYIPQKEVPVLEFIYETLTSTWTKEVEDVQGSTANGLRTLTRVEVARIDTAAPYDEDDVGVVTIADGGKTLYLAGFEDQSKSDNEVQIGRFVTRWAEAGTLLVRRNDVGEGRYQVETTFLAVEGSTTGPIIQRDIRDFNGLQTITVTTLQDAQGNTIVGDGTTPLYSHEVEVPFRYPGEVSIATKTLPIDVYISTEEATADTLTFEDYVFDLKPPVTLDAVEATRYVFYQTSNQISGDDLIFDSAIGRWNPDSWAKGTISALGCRYEKKFKEVVSVRPASQTQVFDQYTAVAPLSESNVGLSIELGTNESGTNESGTNLGTFRAVEGTFVAPGNTFTISVEGGPGRPDGNKYVLAINLDLDFIDPDGNEYYKKEIIVATIPTRS